MFKGVAHFRSTGKEPVNMMPHNFESYVKFWISMLRKNIDIR